MEELNKMKQSMEWANTDFLQDAVEAAPEEAEKLHQLILQGKKEKKMTDFIDKFKIFSDLNDDGNVDITDFKIGLKYFSMIYVGLMSVMYTLLGEDLTQLKDNTYFMVIFGVIAGILTVMGVIARNQVNGEKKKNRKLKSLNIEQASVLYTKDNDMALERHQFALDKMELDFQLRIKDKLVQESILTEEKTKL